MFKQLISQWFLTACMLSLLTAVQAETLQKKDQEYSLVPKVRFQFDLGKSHSEKYQLLDSDSPGQYRGLGFPRKSLLNETRLDQYDAALYYPIAGQGMSFDVGLNMKYINGQTSYLHDGERQTRNFSAAIPMVYATALFDLPFEGFSAGFEGKRDLGLEGNALSGFDYKAKFKYEWDESFGLQGGWQHQQYSLDNADQTTTDFENKGPFLDFYLRF